MSGICEECGHKGERNVRHKGVCEKCGGKMVCRGTPIKNGNGRCRMHGGHAVPPGPGHHTYKDGKHSKLKVVTGLREKIQQEMENAELMSLRQDAAILNVRIQELLDEVDQSGATLNAEKLQSLWLKYQEAEKAGDADRSKQILREIGDVIMENAKTVENWKEVQKLISTRRSVVQADQKIMIESGSMLTAAQSIHAMNMLLNVVLPEITDKKVLRKIRWQFGLITGAAPSMNGEDDPDPVVDVDSQVVVSGKPER
ncbi:hypothetical protein [Thalassoglobus neptunius]|nr:hypothetical protein [Thalassoglobus neptunius]